MNPPIDKATAFKSRMNDARVMFIAIGDEIIPKSQTTKPTTTPAKAPPSQ